MDEENNGHGDVITINLKVSRTMRDSFKKTAKAHGTNMQAVLYSLAENYIENADHMKMRIIDVRSRDVTK